MKYIPGVIIFIIAAIAAVLIFKPPVFFKNTNPALTGSTTTVSTPSDSPEIIEKTSPNTVTDISFNVSGDFTVRVFAKDLGKPRVLKFSPGGTLLASVPSDNLVYALPDKDNNGVADSKKVIVSNEDHVHGLAFYPSNGASSAYNGKLYIADVNKVVRYNWDEEKQEASKDKILFSLPPNGNHNNRVITFSEDGRMFISLGSTCNVCDEPSEKGGSVLISDAQGSAPKVFAFGLRNAAFTTINPVTKELWGVEMGRDFLGDELPPDEVNIIKEGKNYGWPNCYGNKIHDTNFDKNQYFVDPCKDTEAPIFQIPAHSAPLGITFINSTQFPESWQGDLLVSYHGSWNRSVPDGYKVVRMKVEGNTITGVEDFLTGFIQGKDVSGRPVDLIFDKNGNLYLSDDKAGNVYIIQKKN